MKGEGVRRLYAGLSAPLIGGALETGINYAVYQQAMAALSDTTDMIATPISAAAAGFCLSFIVSPAELIKCRLQLGASDPAHKYKGPLDCLRQLFKEEGYYRGLTRGLGHTMAREMPGNAIYFSSYVALREVLPGKVEDSQIPRKLSDHIFDASSAVACGGLAGMLMWLVVLPIDSAKTNKQTATPGSKHDVGLIKQLKLLYRRGGLGSLYAGLTPTLIRAFPANACQWLTWELCMQHFNNPPEGEKTGGSR